MSTYTTRIIIEGGLDFTVELTEGERATILLTIGEARERAAEEELRRREEEQARRRRERANEFRGDPSYTVDGDWNAMFESLKRMSEGFARWGYNVRTDPPTTSPSTPRHPTQPNHPSRPSTPHTVTEALAVLELFAPRWQGSTIAPPASELRASVRRSKRATHPDTGGTATDFQLVTAAEDVLRRAGRI